MIQLLKDSFELVETPLKHLNPMREEKITLTAKNYVSDTFTFQKGETKFTIGAPIVRREYLLISLGGFDMPGQITTLLSRDVDKEFFRSEFQWLIIKADFLKNNQSITFTVKFF